jgi:hypothetical protein
MGVANMMDTVAVKIEISPTIAIFDPDSLSPTYCGEARCGN